MSVDAARAVLTAEGREWAEAAAPLNLCAAVALEPDEWPDGFVDLSVRFANEAGAERAFAFEARRFREAVGAEEALRALRRLRGVAGV